MTVFCGLFAALLGLIFGSFMNMLVYRLPRGISIVRPFSFCHECKSTLKWYNNIPLFSYIFQKGLCFKCGAKIPIRYPIIELTVAAVFYLIFLMGVGNLMTFKLWFFSFMLLAAAFTDIHTRLDKDNFECGVIPDVYTVGAVFAGYIWALFTAPGLYDAIAGSGAGFFILMIPGFFYTLIRKSEGIGLGDALMMAAVGSFLGARAIVIVFTFAAFIGLIVGLAIVIIKKDRHYMIPFAPAIAAAALLYIFAGQRLTDLMM